ncbi:MAG: hypothetical protein LBU58_04635, partial [Clostridiales bacterium]|nr:hypothetical protein [Clostridiales bacterium]
MQLQILHDSTSPDGMPFFRVVRISDGKSGPQVVLTPPHDIQVKGRGMTLRQGLNWYMEDYIEL